jgi:imidazole glycerol-phosphate synthase subunit HisH
LWSIPRRSSGNPRRRRPVGVAAIGEKRDATGALRFSLLKCRSARTFEAAGLSGSRLSALDPRLAPLLAIIDYEMGNLRSVQKAFERVGHTATITSDPAILANADKIVLPGVGAFRDAISALRDRQLVEPIRAAVAAGKPFLGICLGLQLLFDKSYEDGEYEGLGIVPGKVVRFRVPREFKVPHMGWNQVRFERRPPVFEGVPDGSHFYFVHSYYVVPSDESIVATETDYAQPFCSSIWRDNLVAVQFHPEKSQSAGLRVLQNFAEL